MFMFLAYISLINLASTSGKVNPIRAKKSEKKPSGMGCGVWLKMGRGQRRESGRAS